MSDYLKNHLQEQASKQSHLKLLESQWSFDEKLIPKVLQQVGHLFPHYSRHDQSHSEQILVNIERLLGPERIKMLSATDTWLLLEAAYWHDIGMVVPHTDLKSALENIDFQNYRQQVADDETHDLQQFAIHFSGADLSKAFLGANSPLDAIVKFRLLMAEWFRRQHPMRSEKSINDPWNELGLSSPRTELIPKRLFRILGQICALHGAKFDDILLDLSHKEVGMSNDDCHPRFIACLLRLGDLLDMDDNRFCPVMQRIAGDPPALSKAHEDKHSSIRHFRLDSNRIEISAVCDSVDGYVEQWRWVNYLRNEMSVQMARWQDIAPSPALGLLPTLGDIKVDIAGRQLITTQGQRPEFSLNSNKVMALLRGENLYQSEDTIRELLQNSVDATLLRAWIESKTNGENITNIPNEISKNIFEKFSILIKIEKIKLSLSSMNSHESYWNITIIDKGIGISQEDMNYLMSIGSSSTNRRRQANINDMPEWMRPSGTFGIGFQSIFMRTEEVKIKTKNIFTQESLNISLHSPTGKKNGLVTIEIIEDSYLRAVGTELTFKLNFEKNISKFSISHTEQITRNAFDNHDYLLDDELPIPIYKICDAIFKFSKNSPITIKLELKNDDDIEFVEFVKKDQNEDREKNKFNEFFAETNCFFNIYMESARKNILFYRGQEVMDAKLPNFAFFSYSIDLYAGKAGDWLTFNRNNTTKIGMDNIEKIIDYNIILWISKNISILSSSYKKNISAISHFQNDKKDAIYGKLPIDFWEALKEKFSSEWTEFKCKTWTGKIIKDDTFSNALIENNYIHSGHDFYQINNFQLPEASIVLSSMINHVDMVNLCIRFWCKTEKNGIEYIKAEFKNDNDLINSDILIKLIKTENSEKRIKINEDTLRFAIETSIKNLGGNKRLIIPTIILPEELRAKEIILKDGIRSRNFYHIMNQIPFSIQYTILPYEIKQNNNKDLKIELERFDEFIIWIEKNIEKKIKIKEIKEIYKNLITYIDDELMKNSSEWKKGRNNI